MSLAAQPALPLRHLFRASACRPYPLVWLPSAQGRPGRGERSALFPLLEPALRVSLSGRYFYRSPEGAVRRGHATGPSLWRLFDELFAQESAGRQGAWVGWIRYEAGGLADPAIPALADQGEVVLSLARVLGGWCERSGTLERWTPDPRAEGPLGEIEAEAQRWAQLPLPARPPRVRVRLPEEAWYRAAFRSIQEDLERGRFYQLCLTFPLWVDGRVDLVGAAESLLSMAPADFGGYCRWDGLEVASSSPELFWAVDAGRVRARPMKGTRRVVPGREREQRQELRGAEKDRAENVMIVDLLRNDLHRVCVPGSVHVPSLCEVESYANVLQMTSTIEGTLRSGIGPFRLLEATFPPGSMTGAPKVEACRGIAGLERRPRGLYAGSVLWLPFDGAWRANVVIRSLIRDEQGLRWPVGGGIVIDSEEAAEWAEAASKAETLFRCLQERP